MNEFDEKVFAVSQLVNECNSFIRSLTLQVTAKGSPIVKTASVVKRDLMVS